MNRNRPLKPQQTLTYVISIFAYAYVFRCVGECVWHVAPKHTHHVRPSEGHAIPICYTCVCVHGSLAGEARWLWTHGIAARKHDRHRGNLTPRGRRVSLSFRKVLGVRMDGCVDFHSK